MDEDRPEKRYIVLMRVDKAELLPALKFAQAALEGFDRSCRIAFSSDKGETFGAFIRSQRPAAVIRAALDKQYTKADRTFVLVVEIGHEFSAAGNSRGWEWLQHH